MVTDSELNRAMALALGWRSDGTWNGEGVDTGENWYDPKRERTAPSTKPPDFCRDRNTLPEVWRAIESAHRTGRFINNLANSVSRGEGAPMVPFDLIRAEPRVHVIAALCALGAWQPAWDAPATTENDPAAEEMDVPPE